MQNLNLISKKQQEKSKLVDKKPVIFKIIVRKDQKMAEQMCRIIEFKRYYN